jgi:hypothetical protein
MILYVPAPDLPVGAIHIDIFWVFVALAVFVGFETVVRSPA